MPTSADLRPSLPPPVGRWHDDHIASVTTVITLAGIDRFHTSGTTVEQVWLEVLDIVIERRRKTTRSKSSPRACGRPAAAHPRR